MKKLTTVFIFLLGFYISAQHTISGTFSPAQEYTWLIAYRLKPGTQVYAADTAIINGEFSLKLPENSLPGTYRLVYAVPQEEFYFDVIYDGKENIQLAFNSHQGAVFTASEENILFSTYFKTIQDSERELISFYSIGSSDVKAYREIIKKYQEVQKSYENKTVGSIANQFIKANKPYIPSKFENIQEYVQHKKELYFEHLDLSNATLQASGFLTDKMTNYVFTALPLEQLDNSATQKIMQANVDSVFEKLEQVSDAYSFHIGYTLWTQTSGSSFNQTADYIYYTYLKNSAAAETNQEIMDKIAVYNRLRLGAIAPEITWKKGDTVEKLSNLDGAKNYILVFWSSTCGHCLKELPALHKKLKESLDIKVIAVGLEDDDLYWKIESEKLETFEHAIAMGKWESEYAKLYDIHATPSYFILDANKHIIAKPETDIEVVEFLKE